MKNTDCYLNRTTQNSAHTRTLTMSAVQYWQLMISLKVLFNVHRKAVLCVDLNQSISGLQLLYLWLNGDLQLLPKFESSSTTPFDGD